MNNCKYAKKFIMSLIVLAAAVFLFPVFTDNGGIVAQAATKYTSGYYTYTVANGKATITDVNTNISGSINIPSTLGGYPVTVIGKSAFSECTRLTNVTIPDSVTKINSFAFLECSNLTGVTIGNSVTSIGTYAFSRCTGLKSITIPDSVTSIGNFAFVYCYNVTSLTIGNSVTRIGNHVFYYCYKLTSVTIPDSVTSIGNYAFYYCRALKSITIPVSVTSIGSYVFDYCDSLSSINYLGTRDQWNQISISSENPGLMSININYTHTYGAWQTVRAATCTSSGLKKKVCTTCGYEYTESISSLGHSYSTSWTTDINATCTSNGSKSHHCTRCPAKKDVTVINKTAHTEVIDAAVEASCTQTGLTAGKHCSVCRTVLVAQNKVPVTGHIYGAWQTVKAATCTSAGTEKKVCITCNYWYTRSIDPLGHSYSTSWTTDKKATCTSKGSKSHHCIRCSAKKDVTAIKKTSHKYSSEWTVDQEATCSQNGSKSHHCTRCSAKKDITVIKKTGHNYKKVTTAATLKKNGKIAKTCSACKKELTPTVIYKIKTVKLSATSYTYNGKAQTPSVTVTDSKSNKLKKDTDYTVKYSKGRKEIGTYSVKITFKGKYKGTKTLEFNIIPGKVTNLRKASNGTSTGAMWDTVPGVTGYVFEYYSTSSKSWVKTKATTKPYLLLNYSGKSKCRVRAYKTVNGENIYGKYSSELKL